MKAKNLLITLIAAMLWGTTYWVTTEWLPPDRPLLLGAGRALPVAIILMLYVRKLPSRQWWGKIFWLSVFNILLFFALFFYAAYRLPGGIAATIGAFNPFFVALFAWPVLGRKPKKHTLFAAVLGIAGVALLVLDPAFKPDWLGVAAAFGATLAIAPGTVLTKKWGLPDSALASTTWQLLIAGIILAIAALVIEGPLPHLSGRELLAFAYMSFVATGLAYVLWFYGLERLKPHVAAILTLATPLVAVLIDWLLLGKKLDMAQIAGGLIILCAILYESLKQRKASSSKD